MNPLETTEQLLGPGLFLVPCLRGTKVPAVTYTQRPFEATQTPAYRYALASGEFNIAVYLGQMSGGLCALDFDKDEDLAAFLAANPKLRKTLQTRGSRGGMIWLRMAGETEAGTSTEGNEANEALTPGPSPVERARGSAWKGAALSAKAPYPPSCTTARFEWRANGRLSTIYGRHPKGMDYALVVEAAPVTVRFAEIQWPAGWELPWVGAAEREAMADLARQYGQPFYTSKEGRVTGINERYWAALYARENRVLYDPDEKTFYRYEPESGLWLAVTAESIREVISGRILDASREAGQFTLEIQITQTKLKAVVSALMGIVEKREAFRTKQRFIHVANGVIRFTDDGDVQFGGFSPED
jgi:hypothetical protein